MGMTEAAKELERRLIDRDYHQPLDPYPDPKILNEDIKQGFKQLLEIYEKLPEIYEKLPHNPKPEMDYKEKIRIIRLIYNRSKKIFYGKGRLEINKMIEKLDGDKLKELLDHLNGAMNKNPSQP